MEHIVGVSLVTILGNNMCFSLNCLAITDMRLPNVPGEECPFSCTDELYTPLRKSTPLNSSKLLLLCLMGLMKKPSIHFIHSYL